MFVYLDGDGSMSVSKEQLEGFNYPWSECGKAQAVRSGCQGGCLLRKIEVYEKRAGGLVDVQILLEKGRGTPPRQRPASARGPRSPS